jgi:hypothetical protein
VFSGEVLRQKAEQYPHFGVDSLSFNSGTVLSCESAIAGH